MSRGSGNRRPVVRADIAVKHEAIAKDPFALLRGTFYRWLQHWPAICDAEQRAPAVPAIERSPRGELRHMASKAV
jgi:uncharacterized protein (DUF2252 family)